jgi:hypothetical protein
VIGRHLEQAYHCAVNRDECKQLSRDVVTPSA